MELSQRLELIKIRNNDQEKLDTLTMIVEEQKNQIKNYRTN